MDGTERKRSGLKVIADLKVEPVWLNPDHTLETAKHVIVGHRLRGIGVKDGPTLIGTIGYAELIAHPPSSCVGNVCRPITTTLDSGTTLRTAGLRMAAEDADYLPVVDDGEFRGLVSSTMLLKEMSRTWDPLTGLSWSDQLREWGVERLKTGTDVTIIFIDLDDFGQYNKQFGHIVGDRILQKVSRQLIDLVDDATDVLVRYGGDEFAIGTIRSRVDAETLVSEIRAATVDVRVNSVDQPVGLSIGIFGGRRTHERENIHFAATLDTLINGASRDCLIRKAARKGDSATTNLALPPARPFAPVRIANIVVDDSPNRSLTVVTLESNGKTVRGIHQKLPEISAIESVVRATLYGVEHLRLGRTFVLKEIALYDPAPNVTELEVVLDVLEGQSKFASRCRERTNSDLVHQSARLALAACLRMP